MTGPAGPQRYNIARRNLARELASFGLGYWEIAEFCATSRQPELSRYTMRRIFAGTEWPELARMPSSGVPRSR